jgi:hypothetical protein
MLKFIPSPSKARTDDVEEAKEELLIQETDSQAPSSADA